MKLILEGSPVDVRALLVDPNAGYNEARADAKQEQFQSALEVTRKELEQQKSLCDEAHHRLADAERQASAAKHANQTIKSDVEASTARLAARDAEIQRLQFELRNLRTKMDDPIRLTETQEAEIEALYQTTVAEYNIKPLIFSLSNQSGREISAEYMFTVVFGLLAAGNRVGAIKEIRNCTGLGLTKTRDLIDNALRRFGCDIGTNNSPIAAKQ